MKPHRKAINQRIHAKRRAMERFGVELNRIIYRELVDQARAAQPIKNQSLTRKVCKVELPNGLPAVAIYDRSRRTIVTFLAPGMVF